MTAVDTTALTKGVSAAINGSSPDSSGSISSYLSTVTKTTDNLVSSAVNDISTLIGNAESSVTKGVGDLASSIFGNTSTTSPSSLTTQTPDAAAKTLTTAVPKSGFFKTSSGTALATPSTVPGQKSTNSANVFSGITSSLTSLTARFKTSASSTSATGGASSLVSSFMKSSLVSSMYADVTSVTTTAYGAYGVVTAAESVPATIASSAISEYRTLVGSLASLTTSPNALDSLFNSNLPLTTDNYGNTVPGVPSDLSQTALAGLFSTAKAIGCNIADATYTSYAATQSAMGVLLSYASQLNVTSLLASITKCDRFTGVGVDVARSLFYQNAGSNAQVASILQQAVPTNTIASSATLGKTIVTNPNATASDSTAINSMLTNLNISDSSVLGLSDDTTGQVYDLGTISSINPSIASSIDPTVEELQASTGGLTFA